ncbi:hypothetical protein NCU16446 [Neurospora crassa OR74A]|uniref:Uncharacterized protein n=1 Tax=Neurospora crassa (strain ATCC 24698 / 74-OR23-1A / CBS 708.71 / DSM 1257 / FGSC 987) TaxID=367110 RepID=V5IR44_NEUCR|nr:hypothetical protein NCU16446 [Neurospora crassa OR74A]ESA44295.1 hypothetical protein NCU16446 [Neurospora crassa OR74A]|eukprot:XP_011393415.1 hypothetical protein NCU16446 [Neurospora crassa OR74A]
MWATVTASAYLIYKPNARESQTFDIGLGHISLHHNATSDAFQVQHDAVPAFSSSHSIFHPRENTDFLFHYTQSGARAIRREAGLRTRYCRVSSSPTPTLSSPAATTPGCNLPNPSYQTMIPTSATT